MRAVGILPLPSTSVVAASEEINNSTHWKCRRRSIGWPRGIDHVDHQWHVAVDQKQNRREGESAPPEELDLLVEGYHELVHDEAY